MNDLHPTIVPILKKAGVARAALFGSVARGEDTDKSDIDLLIEFSGRKNLFDFIDLKHTLEDSLKRKVDLVTYKALRPEIKVSILQDQQVIYGQRF